MKVKALKMKRNETIFLDTVAPKNPIDLTHAHTVVKRAPSGEKTFKVQRHALGLCVGCDGHANRLWDHVKCYDKSTPAFSYRLIDLSVRRKLGKIQLGT